MTILDFDLDAAATTAASQAAPMDGHPALLRWYGFRTPVHFEIDGVVLLDTTPRSVGVQQEVPSLLDLATWALHRLRTLRDRGQFRYDCGVSGPFLDFLRRGNRVRITSSATHASAETDFPNLLETWETFADRARRGLSGAPALQGSPYWSAWLNGMNGAPSRGLNAQPRLSFTPDDAALDATARLDVHAIPLAALAATQFLLLTEFRVDTIDLFGAPLVLPSLDLALTGLAQLDAAVRTGRSAYLFPESSAFIRFELADSASDSDTLVHYSGTNVVAQVPQHVLRATWRTFAIDVCTYLERCLPALATHPEWHSTLKEADLR